MSALLYESHRCGQKEKTQSQQLINGGDRTIIQCKSDKSQKRIGCSGSTYKGHLIQLCGVSVGREWYIRGVGGAGFQGRFSRKGNFPRNIQTRFQPSKMWKRRWQDQQGLLDEETARINLFRGQREWPFHVTESSFLEWNQRVA